MTWLNTYMRSKRKWFAAACAFALLAALSVGLPIFNGDGTSAFAQGTKALERLLDRSPGERGETDLIKLKSRSGDSLIDKLAKRALGKRVQPEERALGKIFDTPPEVAIGELADSPLGPLASAEGVPADLLPLDDIGNIPGAGSSSSGFPGGIGTVVPSIPGGNPGPTDPTDPTDPGTPTVPAVPEPGTWAMMLVGLGFCAASLRRRGKIARAGFASAR